MATAPELYPFSTQDGKSIPLEIVSPLSMVFQALTTSWSTIVLTSLYEQSVLFSSVNTFLDITNTASGTPASGTPVTGMIFLPANVVVTLSLPASSIKVRSVAGTGDLYINGIRKWAALALPRQYGTKVS